MTMLKDAVVVAYGRSGMAKTGKNGALKNTHPVDFGSDVVKGVLKKIPQLDPADIEDLIVGCARPELHMRFNMARLIVLRAQLPYSVAAETVNRFCSSGLDTIAIAAQRIMTGQGEVILAGGVETMSLVPMGATDEKLKVKWLTENEPGAYMGMGITAENVAKKYGVTRKECDEFALESQKKAAAAQQSGFLGQDIIPVNALQEDGSYIPFATDDGIRAGSTIEKLSELKPVFMEGGVVTAGNASLTNDGAAIVVMMSAEAAKARGLKPLARFVGYAVAGVDPAYMGIGPIAAVPKVMKVTGLSINDMDVIELNEAFAAQSIPCIRELKLDMKKVNPNGGAIAMGHPLGATGGALVCKAISQLKAQGGKYALVTMCIGGGMGAAGIFEALN